MLESGIGLVNAAVANAFAAEQIKPDAIFLLGVAGALSPSLHIGEIVVAQQVIQHDAVFTGENARELMAPGQLHLSVEPHLSSRRMNLVHPRFGLFSAIDSVFGL